jgi:HEAT repeat protein
MIDRQNFHEGLVSIARRAVMIVFLSWSSTSALAQPAPQQPSVPPEAAEVARGWTLLAQGEIVKAAFLALELLPRYPRSIGVLTFAVDAEVARGGAVAGLGAYERWLQGKAIEDGYVLRRVARAVLIESARGKDRSARLQAIEWLMADGDTQFASEVPEMTADNLAEAALLGSAGNAAAVTELIAVLAKPVANKPAAIAALVKTRSPRAVKPLVGVLADSDPAVRAAAAQGLGELGATSAVPHVKPLLQDTVFNVRLNAAGALFALKDMSGLPFLREVQASEHAAIRLAAARAMRGDPDAGWLDLLRSLTKDGDPEVRRQAAELIAPHDPDTARAALEPLLTDSNPAQREAASQSYLQHAVTDFAALRRFLRSAEGDLRLRAAARILELTR